MVSMTTYLQRIDPDRNIYRFYALDVERDLFGEWSLIRRWGRIGTRGRELVETFPDLQAACTAGERRRVMKERRGYLDIKFVDRWPAPDPIQCLDDIYAAIAEARVNDRREIAERVDDRQDTDIPTRRQPTTYETHRPVSHTARSHVSVVP